MNFKMFRRLRPLASLVPEPPKRTIGGFAKMCAAETPRLCPHPPPRRNTEGIATMCAAETPRLRPHPRPRIDIEGIAKMCAAETPRLRPHPPPRRNTEGIAKMCAAETPRLRPHPPPRRNTEGIAKMCAAETPRLRPHPPPRRNTEGIAKMCAAETPRLRPHPPLRRNTEGIATMWEFHYKNIPFNLPPIFGPSQPRGVSPYPSSVQGLRDPLVTYGIGSVQFETDLFRQRSRSEFFEREGKKEALCPRHQHPAQQKSASPDRELKATKAPDANRVELKKEEPEALERKVSEPKIEPGEMVLSEPVEAEEGNSNSEEMVLTESKEPEEGNSSNCNNLMRGFPDFIEIDREIDTDEFLWRHKNKLDEYLDNLEVLRCHQAKVQKMKEKADHIKEETVKIEGLIKEPEELLKFIHVLLEKKPDNKSASSKRKTQQKISEKLAKIFEKCFDRFCCPAFLIIMLIDLDEWSYELADITPAETLQQEQMEFWNHYDKSIRVNEQAEIKARREERWQRRREQALERALAPPAKMSGKKVMTRSPPPEKVVKKVETKKQE